MSRPFHGLTFCCTGLGSAHRHELESQINALGGSLQVDLMSSVNVLVVGGRRTEKYKYSVRYRHDIAFVAPEAIADIHSRWVAGADSALTLDSHLLPVFHNMTVCVARVEPPSPETRRRLFAERFRSPPPSAVPPVLPADPFSAENLVETLARLGADVSGTLTSDCAVVVGTDAAGKRFRTAQEWNVPVVHPLWVYDSCLRGAALHLDDYELTPGTLNLYSSGSFAWKSLYLARSRPRAAVQAAPEKRPMKKASDVWASIMSSTRSHAATEVRDSAWEDSGEQREKDQTKIAAEPAAARDVSSSPPPSKSSSLFAGLTFLPVGLSVREQNILKKVVESHSGVFAAATETPALTHILLLARDGPQAHLMLSMLPSAVKRRVNSKEISVVTDWFIERSIFYNRVAPDAWSAPMDGIVPSLRRYQVCISGFTGVEALHIEKLIGYLNLEFCPVFTSKRDLLVVNISLFKRSLSHNCPALFESRHRDVVACPTYNNGEASSSVSGRASKNKIDAAKKWGIPVVSLAYLWEMVETSAGQPNLQLPDITDPSMSIFIPGKVSRPSSLMGFLRNSHASEKDAVTQDESVEERVQLPSPRKSKDKQKYGRLVGGGESLTEKLLNSKEHEERVGEPDISVNDDENLTQVGYGSADSNKGDNDLWKKLGDVSERLPKRRRTRG